jgi:hypothetical protein
MLLRSRRTFSKPHKVFTDLREAEKEIFILNPLGAPIDFLINNLPDWCNKEYKRGNDVYNPFKMLCTCEEYRESAGEYEPMDYRRVCRHLYAFYMQRLKKDINPLAVLLMEQNKKHGPEELIRAELSGKEFYYGFQRTSEWINIYCNENQWIRFSYNIAQKRWSENIAPKNNEAFVEALKKCFTINTKSK